MAVRVISGSLKGRKIAVPDISGLRPTSDRVRETLFNWLQSSIVGSCCLDLFAGSGSLSFEAYSRGAAKLVCIESNHIAYKAIQSNASQWSVSQDFRCVNADSIDWLRQYTGVAFDIIFLDPPFQGQYLHQVLHLISEAACLHPDGVLYIERHKDQCISDLCEVLKEQKAGSVIYGLYKFC